MERVSIHPRDNWEEKIREQGFLFYKGYYNESAAYQFTAHEVDRIEAASKELFARCLDVVQYVIDNELWDEFFIPRKYADLIKRSWDNDSPSFYGRFDLAVNEDCSQIKMLEFNGDTPTSLLEASVIQWYWLQDYNKNYDQYNSIHEKLVNHMKECKGYLYGDSKIWFASVRDSYEDYMTVKYLQDIANQAEIENEFIYIDEIGIINDNSAVTPFISPNESPINNVFKLYPYEWLFNEEFAEKLNEKSELTLWIEPAYKAILSNKMLLVYLHKLFPAHENILPAFAEESKELENSYVRKPIYGREGSNIKICKDGDIKEQTNGEYGYEGFVYQKYFELPNFNGMRPVVGSWIVGGEPAGMGLKETSGLIHGNLSLFCPHFFK